MPNQWDFMPTPILQDFKHSKYLDLFLHWCARGAGIPATEHERVFERFQQTEHNRTCGGLGLGLWISRQIVTAMGGTIELKSEPGSGAEFTVTLPRDVPRA